MPAPRHTSTLFPSVLCGTDNSASGVAARRQAAWLAGSNGLVELAPQRELTDLGSRALAERCRGHELLVLGSEGNARTLIACAPVPVLFARWCPADRDVTDEILVAVGDHAGAERAAELAANLAVRRGGSVSVVPAPGRMHDLARAIAATQRIVLCTAGTTPRMLNEFARPEVAISRAAAQIDASLLVLGVGDDAWSAAEAADIARHTGCSLLAVPELTARSARESSRSRRTDTPRRTDRSPHRKSRSISYAYGPGSSSLITASREASWSQRSRRSRLAGMAEGPRRFQRSERRPAPGFPLAGPSSDITPLPDLVHGRSRAGPVRSERPVYVDLLPPCNSACPAGEDIQTYLAHVKAGEHERAWRVLVEDNPFAAIHGRVCYHPCETSCNRAHLDSAVSIHAVERFLGDLALQRGWRFDRPPVRSGRRVLVVGAGPSGLSAAYHLARLGHDVEIRDAGPEPGGMMRYGIPAYRMPRDVLSGEVERIADLGVRMIGDHRVVDLEAERRDGGFDAVFVAVGAHLSKRVDIPARDAGAIVDAVSFLRSVASGEQPVIGRRVAVYGGGNTAMDAARVARRLGAEEALIVYRRTRAQMPAHEQEAEDAEREGVRINWLRTIKEFEGPELQVEVMELDESGYPQPTGRFETLAADTVILALGQETDTAFLRAVPGVEFERDGTVKVSASLMTGCPGVFAGGDMVPAERTVTVGVGHGKRAAREIDAWLRGTSLDRPPKHPPATFDLLNLWYFGDADTRPQPELEPSERVEGFEEVLGGLTVQDATFEASRCLSCGNCCECDGCLGACPEDAVIKLGPGHRYRFDYDRCTGCRACFEQCPVHSIEMFPEPR